MNLTPIPLEGTIVSLIPIAPELFPRLIEAALSAPEVWTHVPYAMRNASDVAQALDRAIALQNRGEAITFATCLGSGEVAGGTSLRVVDHHLPSVEIGATWVLPRWQRTAVNTEAKLLQLQYCFEQLECQRVELKTDIRNERSQRAIARIGARREGVLRAHMRRLDGTLRDSVLFSIVHGEWPDVKEQLRVRQRSFGNCADA
jgi:RimJ/RimL family protein N-acetyltransferase